MTLLIIILIVLLLAGGGGYGYRSGYYGPGVFGGGLGLIVGDCVGCGVEAAAVMGQLRSVSHSLMLLGKTPVEVPDIPGFVVNRLLFPYLFDAVRLQSETGIEVEMLVQQLPGPSAALRIGKRRSNLAQQRRVLFGRTQFDAD